MQVLHNYSLQRLNTFGLAANAKTLILLANDEDFQIFQNSEYLKDNPLFILGGGSNLLFTSDFIGTIVKPANSSIEIISEDNKNLIVKAGAGMVWDDFVALCNGHGWFGLENLSDIPGNVGAAPIQNIGAYGVEAKDFIYEVYGINLETKEFITLANNECNFGYRDSVFKHELRGKFLVQHVSFKLNKVANPVLDYGAVKEEYEKHGATGPASLRQVIKRIRREKLPLYEQIGNAGSFFKNPVIRTEHFKNIQKDFAKTPSYKISDEEVKIPAAWLIEQSGYKGKEKGNVATHQIQPLVIINKGNASGKDILDFSEEIVREVKSRFDIELSREVIVI